MAKKLWIILGFLLIPSVAFAHPGNLDARGGHFCWTNCEKYGLAYGQYHFHYERMDAAALARYDAFHDRLCKRVAKRFSDNATAFGRVNARIHLRLGFDCRNSVPAPKSMPEVTRGQRSTAKSTASGALTQPATVLRIIDGDTIEVRIDHGATERVRFIGMDTPEVGRGSTPGECYADEARTRLKQLLGGAQVLLVFRTGDNRDKYGRLLRYVEKNGRDIGLEMLQGGFAHNYPWFGHPRTKQYKAAEDQAHRKMVGLWGECE